MNLLQILAIYQPLLPNLYGSQLKVILIWKFFLRQVASDLFKTIERPLGYSNLSREEWDAIRSLADDRNVVIKRTGKGSCVVIWDRNDYVKEVEIQLSNQNVYKSVEFKNKTLTEYVEKSNHFFQIFKDKWYNIGKRASVFYIQIQKSN